MSWNYLAFFRKTPSSSFRNDHEQSGFGLIELMVSLTIMMIVTTIIMVRQSSFNDAVLLRNQAYEIALHIREVQLSAVGSIGSNANFRSVMGVHFDTANSQDNSYRIFKDAPTLNGFYNTGEEFGIQGVLDKKFEVRAIRAVGDSYDGNGLSVIFERPNFDARFFDSSGEVTASKVEIDISKECDNTTCSGEVRTIEITSTGQIAVL